MIDFRQAREIIEKRISELDLPVTPPGLYDPIRYIMSIGGKRLRPALVLVAASLYRDDIEEAVLPALAMEIFHNFTLLHDDIMDNASLRRNNPTVHIRWSHNTAILSGDVMSILSYRYLLQTRPAILPALLEVFTKTAVEVCEGQQMDMDFESRSEVQVEEYMRMIELKTSVLIAASLKIGALVGGASEKDADLLYHFGKNLGLAFQLRDDYLDVFGDPSRFGKSLGGDILADKKTFLLLKALETAKGQERKELLSPRSAKMPDSIKKVQRVTSIFKRLRVDETAKKEMEKYYTIALEKLGEISLPPERKKVLEDMATILMRREE
jgi:geranylgeranyl diphosphate synthase type II